MMKLQKVSMTAFFFAVTAAYTQAGETVNCPGTITASIDDSVSLSGQGTCVLAEGVEITGDVTVPSGVSFTVKGLVDGKIDEIGDGRVLVDGGMVNNDILESGAGSVNVINSALVRGKIDESGAGRVRVSDSTVENDLLEAGNGPIIVLGSLISGNVDEEGRGSVTVDSASQVQGNVFEEGAGNCNNVDASAVEGVVDCD